MLAPRCPTGGSSKIIILRREKILFYQKIFFVFLVFRPFFFFALCTAIDQEGERCSRSTTISLVLLMPNRIGKEAESNKIS